MKRSLFLTMLTMALLSAAWAQNENACLNAGMTDTTETANADITQAGIVSLAPDSLVFGTSPQTATLTNVGSTPVSIFGITMTGNNPGDFAQRNTCGASLRPGVSCIIEVTFTPTSCGSFSATVSISDSGVESTHQISLSGTTGSHCPPPRHHPPI